MEDNLLSAARAVPPGSGGCPRRSQPQEGTDTDLVIHLRVGPADELELQLAARLKAQKEGIKGHVVLPAFTLRLKFFKLQNVPINKMQLDVQVPAAYLIFPEEQLIKGSEV
ncbi:hypothetical protein NDU88_002323 [Pleurodeles waltl]|uniref:Uncharacterized protein n=1 Tax=Pleurodeles waltl TaxID=8319 RepID=A0AAV7VZ12_PLEWA|nr:hypothetical protein NDU88_002323 [Pleurodeles waltl]